MTKVSTSMMTLGTILRLLRTPRDSESIAAVGTSSSPFVRETKMNAHLIQMITSFDRGFDHVSHGIFE